MGRVTIMEAERRLAAQVAGMSLEELADVVFRGKQLGFRTRLQELAETEIYRRTLLESEASRHQVAASQASQEQHDKDADADDAQIRAEAEAAARGVEL